jgi:hypothetical protein
MRRDALRLDLKQRYPGRGPELVQSSSRFAQQLRVGSGISVVGECQVLCPLHAAAGQGRSADPSADGVGAGVHDPTVQSILASRYGSMLCCHREDSGWIIVARRRHGNGVRRRYCTVAFRRWSQPDNRPLTASLQVTLRLESTLLGFRQM